MSLTPRWLPYFPSYLWDLNPNMHDCCVKSPSWASNSTPSGYTGLRTDSLFLPYEAGKQERWASDETRSFTLLRLGARECESVVHVTLWMEDGLKNNPNAPCYNRSEMMLMFMPSVCELWNLPDWACFSVHLFQWLGLLPPLGVAGLVGEP